MPNIERQPWEVAEKTKLPGGYLTGVIGAIIGSLLGAVVLVLIDRLGYVSALSGLAIAFLAARGYKLLGGPINKAMPFIIAVIVVVGTLVGVFASIIFWAVTDYGYTVGEAIQIARFLWQTDPEFVSEVLIACIMPLLFSIIGAWATIRRLYKEAAGGVMPENTDRGDIPEQ